VANDDGTALEAGVDDVVRLAKEDKYGLVYSAWLSRPPTSGVKPGDWVLLPAILGSARGKVKWSNEREWAVHVPFPMTHGGGVFLYVHKADVQLAEWQAE
jgi:hypothetical protein